MKNGYNGPEEYRPISMWGYFGYEILFSIPCIGIIALIICAFSKNINVRNFARSYFCAIILFLIMVGIIVALGGGAQLLEYVTEYASNVAS